MAIDFTDWIIPHQCGFEFDTLNRSDILPKQLQQKGIMKMVWKAVLFASLVLASLNVLAQTPRNATATAITFNGFVVDATVNDGGAGYIYPPDVAFSGSGSGAGAYSVVSGVGDFAAVHPAV
jgi:hypothetical protein